MILDDIVEYTKRRVQKNKSEKPLKQIMIQINENSLKNEKEVRNSFENALRKKGFHIISEVKKASPSKGIIVDNFPYIEIAKEYEKMGASCISVLTEPHFFMGSNQYLIDIKQTVSVPILRKDFIIDEYQIYESKAIGADCILLICAILSNQQLQDYIQLASSLGMSALVEAHNEEEVQRALEANASIIGVNNRDLYTFNVDFSNSQKLRSLVPENIVFVAESGIRTKEDIRILKNIKVNAVLIGEAFMGNTNKKELFDEFYCE